MSRLNSITTLAERRFYRFSVLQLPAQIDDLACAIVAGTRSVPATFLSGPELRRFATIKKLLQRRQSRWMVAAEEVGEVSILRGLFITGTDTGVGKTYVACRLIAALRDRGIRVGAYKPVVSGCVAGPVGPVWEDPARLQAALGGDVPIERIGPQRFQASLAPPVAARLEGREVDAVLLRSGIDWWRGRADAVVVEGAGGLLSPVTETESVADLAVSFAFPLVVVARVSLGTINHTLLTLEAARSRGLVVAGIVLNHSTLPGSDDRSVESNPGELEKRCGVPILAILPHDSTPDLLRQTPLFTIDWMRFMSNRASV
jgi:dethiobiotin synthetase